MIKAAAVALIATIALTGCRPPLLLDDVAPDTGTQTEPKPKAGVGDKGRGVGPRCFQAPCP